MSTTAGKPVDVQAPGSPDSFFRSVLWQTLDRGLLGVLGFAVNVVVARSIGVEASGQLASVLALVTIVGAVTTMGIDASMPRALLAGRIAEAEILATALLVRRVAGLLAWILILAVAAAVLGIHSPYFTLAALLGAIWMFPGGELVELFWVAKGQSRNYLPQKFLAIGSGRLIKLAAAQSPAGVIAVAAAQWLEYVLNEAAQLRALRRRTLEGRFAASREAARVLLRNNLPLIMAALAVIGYQRLDQVMVLHYLGPIHAGQYAAAVQFYDLSLAVVLILGKAAIHSITTTARQDQGSAVLLQRLRTAAFVGWIAFPAFWFGADPVIRILYGEAFAPAADPMRWFGLALGLSAFGTLSGIWLVARGLEHLTLQRTVAGLAVNFLLNLVLIPRHGPEGAAVATVIAQFAAAWGFDALHPSTRTVFWLKLRAALTPFPHTAP